MTSDKLLTFHTVIAYLILSRAEFGTAAVIVLPCLGPEVQETSWGLPMCIFNAAMVKSVFGVVLLCNPSAPSRQLQEVSVVPTFLLKDISVSVIKFMDFFHGVT
jgi:hypothetical protein